MAVISGVIANVSQVSLQCFLLPEYIVYLGDRSQKYIGPKAKNSAHLT